MCEIDSLIETLDTLKISFESNSKEDFFIQEASTAILQKVDISSSFINLKRLTDSLLLVAIHIDSIILNPLQSRPYDPVFLKTTVDTVNVFTRTEKSKKGLFGRVLDFLKGGTEKETTQQQLALTTKHSLTSGNTATTSRNNLINNTVPGNKNNYFREQLKTQQTNRNKLESTERLLIETNNELLARLKNILNALNLQVEHRNKEISGIALKIIDKSSQKLNRISLISIVLVLFLTLFIFIVLRQINYYESLAREEMIKHLKASEDRYRKLTEELEVRVAERTVQLEKVNHELESFAYSVSHDLRAPLRHINGFIRMLSDSFADKTQEHESFFNKVFESSAKMSKMIDDLLTFSRLGKKSLNKTEVNLNEIVTKAIHQCTPDFEHRQVEWKIDKLPVVQGDANLLQLVFVNLISNALKFTSKKEKAILEIGKCNKSEKCVVYIKDNGVGFDMEYAGKLFGVFQRLHTQQEFEGTGIGLANVKQIIQKHGGTITAKGELNKGATFYINL